MIRLAFAFLLSLCVSAQAQLSGGVGGFPGPGTAHSTATYTGPGDVVAGAIAWGSCARVYTAAQASTATSLCDLVAVTGGAAVCTLRGSSSGFVDLAASYCAGTTPAAACAAASGGSCKVTKVYDQAGATGGWTQVTLGTMPGLTFSAINGVPALSCVSASNTVMSTGNITQAQPLTLIGVGKRTSGTTLSGIIANGGGANLNLGYSNAVDTAYLTAGTAITATATDNNFHALIGAIMNGTTASIVVDGSATSGSPSAASFSAQAIRICRSSAGVTMDGQIMEIGLYSGAFNSTQYGDMNTNIHSANGYNF